MTVHEPSEVSLHFSHAYTKVIGWLPVHVPLLALNERPTFAGPEIDGSCVFTGAAEDAANVAVNVCPPAGAMKLCVCAPPSDQEEKL